jgi:hypothetical protein
MIDRYYAYPDEIEDKLIRLLEKGTVYNLETFLRGPGGPPRRVLDTSWLSRDEAGNATGYSSLFRDIT